MALQDFPDFISDSPRIEIKDKIIKSGLEIKNTDFFTNNSFIRLVAKNVTFKKINFKYAFFETCYLKDCKFIDCDFTGCKFISSNMRGSSFQGCVFDYALFERTYIEHYILDDQCPSTENRIQIFARSLRLNFQQIGDKLGENKAIKVELDATKVHFKKACFSKESYYRNKYKGFVRAKEILSYLKFTILEKLLGNMESIPILFRNIFVILATITAIDFIKFNKNKYSVSEIFINNINLFIDGKSNPSDYPLFIVNFIILTKLLSIGCILSVLIKMSARR